MKDILKRMGEALKAATTAIGYHELLNKSNENTIAILENIKKEQDQYIKQLEDRNNQLRLELDYAHKRIKEIIQQDENK